MNLKSRSSIATGLLVAALAAGGCGGGNASPTPSVSGATSPILRASATSSARPLATPTPSPSPLPSPTAYTGRSFDNIVAFDGDLAWTNTTDSLLVSHDRARTWQTLPAPAGIKAPDGAWFDSPAFGGAAGRAIWAAATRADGYIVVSRLDLGQPSSVSQPVWSTTSIKPKAPAGSGATVAPQVYAVAPGPAGTVYLSGLFPQGMGQGYAFILKSVDDGRSFVQLPLAKQAWVMYWGTLAFSTPQEGVADTNSAASPFRTTDGGATWTPVSVPRGNNLYYSGLIAKGDVIRMVGVTDDGSGAGRTETLLTSRDGGATFKSTTPVDVADGGAVSDPFGTIAWVLAGQGVMFKTEDDGATWSKVTSDSIPSAFYLHLTGPQSAIAQSSSSVCSEDGSSCRQLWTLYETVDGGLTWNVI
jgi:photosystem II stability/assembly factor-like uncharacterized protein